MPHSHSPTRRARSNRACFWHRDFAKGRWVSRTEKVLGGDYLHAHDLDAQRPGVSKYLSDDGEQVCRIYANDKVMATVIARHG